MAFSQQQPQYTQYMYNMRTVNPGYMINLPDVIEVGGTYRTQWVGINGSPKTANLFASIPLNDNIELGLNYFNDRIGSKAKVSTNTFNVDAAYKVNLTEKTNISFGLKAGFTNVGLNTSDLNDPAIRNSNETSLNLGAGLFLFHPNYYLGFSSPNIIAGDVENNAGNYQNNFHMYFIGGYIFNLGLDIKLKPSFVIKKTTGAPLSLDVSANALFYNKFELGVSYRTEDAIAALASFHVTPYLRLGYSYDFGTSDLTTFGSGSHEFVLLYQFDILRLRKKYISPRFY